MRCNGKELIEALRTERPDVAIRVTKELDDTYVWDGDGPDPADDGFAAYTVKVEAITIRNGKAYTGTAYLGGSYYKYGEPVDLIHEDVGGYLPQLIDEALKELDTASKEAE